MNKVEMPYQQRAGKAASSKEENARALFSDVKALVKAPVLIANVLPVFTGLWLAMHFTHTSLIAYWEIVLLTILGSTFVMAGALILNNWYDVDIDTVMERTKHRPTVTGSIPLPIILTLGIIFTCLGFVLLLFTTLEATIYAFVGWFTYVILYTMWSKRRYTLNTVIGSISGAVSPLIGWAANESTWHVVPIVLFLILFIWQMPHTFAIAMIKYKEYRAAKVAMLPVVHGFEMTKRQMLIYIVCLLPLPFYLAMLGTAFVLIATLLNVTWLVMSITGFFVRNDLKWAHYMFIFSVGYISVLFIMMIIVTLPF
jgi:protoheme IX farnesyltransferase